MTYAGGERVRQLDRLKVEFGFFELRGRGIACRSCGRYPEFDVPANGLITVISSSGSVPRSVTRHGMDDFIDSFWTQRLIIYLLRREAGQGIFDVTTVSK